MLAISVDAIYGDIGATVIDSYEWTLTGGYYPDMIRLGTSEYYLVTGVTLVQTIRVWNGNGTIQKSIVDSLNLGVGNWPRLCHVYGDIYAVACGSNSAVTKSTVKTFLADDADGQIGAAAIDTLTCVYGGNIPSFIKVSGNMFAFAQYNLSATIGQLESVYISNSGIMSATSNDTACFNSTAIVNHPNMEAIDSDTIAIVYQGSGNDGYVCTYNISVTTGLITDTKASEWEFDTVNGQFPNIEHISGDVYAIAYVDTNADIQVKTLTISSNGAITKSWIDTLVMGAETCSYRPTLFVVNNLSVYGVAYRGTDTDGWVKTFNMTADGQIGATFIDSLEFDNADTKYHSLVSYVNKSWYLIVYSGTDYHGQARTVSITTNYASPVLSSPSPVNVSTGNILTPTCAITVSDLNADLMTINFYENSTGSWVLRQTNSSVANGTYRWHDTLATVYGTRYWWRVYANDSLNNVSATYRFKTDSPVVFSNENPVNNSIDVNISMVLWNITMDDPNGDLFNWTIECSGWNVTNDNYDSATGETNGSKEVHLGWQLGYPLWYSTVYTIWVNATDGVLWTREWFRLTTIHFPYSIILSGEDPSNGSTIVYTFPGYLGLTHFNMSITRNHSKGYDMNTTIWFNGTLLFTNATWGNGTITFDLFDYWGGVLIDGSYNWMVNASENAVYSNESYWFNFTVNVSGVVAGGPMLVLMTMDLSRFLFVGVLMSLIIMLVLSRRRKKKP